MTTDEQAIRNAVQLYFLSTYNGDAAMVKARKIFTA